MTKNAQTTIQPKTVGQAVYESLRLSILDGTRAPGSRLNQDSIAAELGVSRMPVREALKRLQSEGMVLLETYRGAFVRPLTVDELEQLYLMRLALEPLLARLATERLEQGDAAELASIQAEMQRALAAGDPGSVFDRVRAFHEMLYAAADRPMILEQILGLRDLAQRYIRRYLMLPGRLAHVIENHSDILSAARAGDAPKVERLIREELEVTRDALLTSLAADAPPAG